MFLKKWKDLPIKANQFGLRIRVLGHKGYNDAEEGGEVSKSHFVPDDSRESV